MFLQCKALHEYLSVYPWLITVIQMEIGNMLIYNLQLLTVLQLYLYTIYIHTVITDKVNVVIYILNTEMFNWLKKYDSAFDKKI